MRRTKKIRLLPAISFLLLFSFSAMATFGWQDDISVEDYCRLTQSLMELSVQEWQGRLDLATQSKNDRKGLSQKLEAVTKRSKPLRDEIYLHYGMSPKDELRYASDHRPEIESYLEENPEVRDSIDSLKKRIDDLIQRFEAAAPPPSEGAQR
jgi:hypothetical protein